MPSTITIEWLTDSHDCETCGWSSASGAIVKLNDDVILELEPFAHCYDVETWYKEDVYSEILRHLGYSVEEIEE